MDHAGEEISPKKQEVELQQVLGLTVCNNSALDSDSQSSTVAYPAGCVVVLYNARKNKQRYIINDANRPITTLSFSWDGKYLATGECGTVSHLRIWDVHKGTQVADLSGHKHGINCVAFSPNMKYVVSVGSQHDMVVNVWDWKSKVKVASNKVSCKVKALSFSAGGNYFVTVGNNHVKFWYLEYSRSTKYKLEPVPLMGRSAILGDQRNNYFCDVACGRGESADSTFAITKSGLLCEFNGRRLLDKWVELRISVANSISVGENFIFIGCSDGIVRCFSPTDLHFICTLPRPHCLGVDVAKGLSGRQMNSHTSAKYPDVIAVTLDEVNKKVTCVYNDHSLYVWDIRDIKKIGKSHSFLYHSACIWGIEMFPELSEGDESILPPGTFFTCANDDTIRIWNLEPNMNTNSTLKRNIYCFELLKILYTSADLTSLCDMDLTPVGINDKPDNAYDEKNGVRCLKIRPDGHHLASGDRSGNIRVYDLKYMEMLCKIEAHDSEVLCLEYSKPLSDSGSSQLLSSASRDRLIHIFDVHKDYSFLQTLDDHTSSVTATKFICSKNDIHFVSCGADKAVIFRKAQLSPSIKIFQEHALIEKTTFYDMEVDMSQYHVLAACQDSKIRVYNVINGKHSRTFSGAQGDGSIIKVAIDTMGSFVATSATDKCLYIYDYLTGQCVASMTGHSELVTGLKFTPSRKNLISVSGDSCIFVWKLPSHVAKVPSSAKHILHSSPISSLWQDNRKSVVAVTKPFQSESSGESKIDRFESDTSSSPYDFNVGQLPSWAKKQISNDLKQPTSLNKSSPPPIQPRGRWAQRLDGQALVVRSYLNTDSVIPFPQAQGEQQSEHTTIRYVSTESRNCVNFKEETISSSKQVSISRTSLLQENETSQSSGSLPGSKHERVRHPTDSSSASSIRMDDGDAEDERSDSGATENSELIYYPNSEENSESKDSSFHICAIKEEKPSHKNRSGILRSQSSFSIPDKTDTVSDDEDSGTPVETERPLVNSFSMSTENLERLGMREKYMLDNYESLNKGHHEDDNHNNRYSISSKYHTKSPNNVRTTSTSGRTTPHQTYSKKREELTRALNDARKKLETLGFKGSLGTSKSVGDLRNVSEKDYSQEKPRSAIKDDFSDMRRSTSYGDISFARSSPRRRLPSTPQSGSQHAPLWAQAKKIEINAELSDPDCLKLSRSSAISRNLHHSSSALNISQEHRKGNPTPPPVTVVTAPSHTEPPTTNASPLSKSQSSITLNTFGKTSGTSRRLSLTGVNRRLNYSDSSSSDASPTETRSNSLVPRGIVARRMRAFCPETPNRGSASDSKNRRNSKTDREPSKSKSEWDLRKLSFDNELPPQSGNEKQQTAKVHDNSWSALSPPPLTPSENIKHLEVSPMDLPVRDRTPATSNNNSDVNSVVLTQELCEKMSEELKRVTSFTVQLFQRITIDPHLTPSEKTSMTTTLAQGVWQAQQNLQPATSHIQNSKPDSQSDPLAAMALLQQYSDRLLSLVEQKITKGDK